MLPSFHDDLLIAYEVSCAGRQIKLVIRPAGPQANSVRTVVFSGVEGYHLHNDAFGNVIFSLQETPIERLLSQLGPQIAESYRVAGP